MSTVTEVRSTWSEVRAWLAEARPDLAAELRPGADDEALAELAALGLPEEWRAWWKTNDGAGPVLFHGWTWLPVRGVVDSVLSEYDALLEMATHLAHESPPAAEGPVQPVWGHRDWVPFAVDFAGCLLCIDLAPAEGGHRGQVILVDDDTRKVLYDGPASFFADCLMRMEMGIHPDDEPDPDTDEWAGEGNFDHMVAGQAPPPPPEPKVAPPVPKAPPKPAELAREPTVRAEAVQHNGCAVATILLDAAERSKGGTVFVRQLGGHVVGVRVPAGAFDGARLRLPGLGGEGVDLELVVSAGAPSVGFAATSP